jgi:uncharacterized protein (DUF58 family)
MSDENKVHTTLRKVRQIELRARVLLNEVLSGTYHSVFKGQGVNFEEVREYCFGDEIRFIDWNITAKMGHPFIKIFREERELTLLLAVDISGSNEWGSTQQTKREFSAEIASVLAFSAAKNNDKVGLVLFSDQVELFIPPRKGHQHLLRIIREILFFKPKHTSTHIPKFLSALGQLQKRKAIVGIISDFVPTHPEENLEHEIIKSLSLLNQCHDLICIRVDDPRECQLPNVGYITLQDAETQQLFYLNTHSMQTRQRFENLAREKSKNFQSNCQKCGIDIIQLHNGQPYLPLLQSFFNTRKQLKR